MTPRENEIITIDHAENAGDFRLRLTFNDGSVRTVDIGAFLRRSGNPLIQAYLEPARFAQFTIKDGDLVWGDYDLCFPIADLYDGEL